MNTRPKIITLTGAHWTWKDTLIAWLCQVIDHSARVVSTTDRLPRPWEIAWEHYYYAEQVPPDEKLYAVIHFPVFNTRTGQAWYSYWVTHEYIASLFDAHPDTTYLWHTGLPVVKKLKAQFPGKVYSIYLYADTDVRIARLMERDAMMREQVLDRLAHDPWDIPPGERWIFDIVIDTSEKTAEEVMREVVG